MAVALEVPQLSYSESTEEKTEEGNPHQAR